ncbi:endonuclease/exonuclease/phosphatase family protein [Kamptonema formosum]|uniref:endonuclease/exonuclease/phosphatase family protein n=1 Tax=Kamptonema formosum TaxID=331992 RepID=UPI0003467F46|nr:endonuclease/exonuclease/phosphatase family protein [Oscillatoria sp. PCC 10802]
MSSILDRLIARIKLYRLLQLTAQLLACTYSGLIASYLILRLLFWDRLWPVAFAGTFVPWILFPILLLPILALFIIRKRWFAIVSSVACLWLLGWLHLTYFSPQPAAASGAPSIKVLSLNCGWYKTSSETLANLIQQEQPDLIFLQEIVLKHTQRAFVWLKASYPYQFGQPPAAILSKSPILYSEIIHLAGHQEVQQRAVIQINRQGVAVYNISTISPWIRPHKILPFLTVPAYEYADRSAEIKDLVARVQKETLPVIAAGDFNMTDQSQDYHELSAVMRDAFRTAGLGFGFTWPDGWDLNFILKKFSWKLSVPLVRIDYIWHSPHWGSLSAKVLPAAGSEHLPVGAELLLSNFPPSLPKEFIPQKFKNARR